MEQIMGSRLRRLCCQHSRRDILVGRQAGRTRRLRTRGFLAHVLDLYSWYYPGWTRNAKTFVDCGESDFRPRFQPTQFGNSENAGQRVYGTALIIGVSHIVNVQLEGCIFFCGYESIF